MVPFTWRQKGTVPNMKKFLRALPSVLLSLTMVFTVFSTTIMADDSSSQTPPPVVDREAAKGADLFVEKIENQFFQQGLNSSVFAIKLGNRNMNTALDVKVSVTGDGDFANKFSIVEGTSTYFVVDTMYNRRDFITSLKVDPSVPNGVYTLNIKLDYKTADDVPVPAVTEKVIIYVDGSNSSRPFVKSVTFDKAEIGKDNKVKLTANLENPTQFKYEGVKVALRSAESKDFTLYQDFQPVYVPAIEPHSSTAFDFYVYVAPTVLSGNYPIAFDLTFRDEAFVVHNYPTALYAQVKRSPDAEGSKDGSTPRIIVSKYSIDVEEIKAGKSFTLDFTLENTSAMSVGNMKVTVGSAVVTGTGSQAGGSSSGEVFFPAEGSNSFFIEKLASKSSVSKKIKLMAKMDVEPGVYPVQLELEYEGDGAKQFKTNESIAFPVSQEQRLEVVGLNISPAGMVDAPIPVNFQYINKGKSTINNVSITVDGEFTMDGGDVFIGNLTAGYNDYFDNSITPKKEGSQKGAIVLQYEDSQGNPKEMRNEFTVEVAAGGGISADGGMGIGGGTGMMPTPPDGMMMDPETGEMIPIKKGGIALWLIISIAVAVLLVAGGVFLFIRKKRKAKKSLALLNEE